MIKILENIYNKHVKKHLHIMSRTKLINYLIKKYNLVSYLEIGLNNPYCNFVKIRAKEKYSVDPYYTDIIDGNTEDGIAEWSRFCTHRMTSDEFFEQNSKNFDIIFIDGLHEEHQVDKDIQNSLKVLKTGGFIVIHDCLPESKGAQAVPRQQPIWNGTVWKSFVKMNLLKNPGLKLYVLNTDWGCGIIQKKGEVDYPLPEPLEMSWEHFSENKETLYNIVEPQDLKSKL